MTGCRYEFENGASCIDNGAGYIYPYIYIYIYILVIAHQASLSYYMTMITESASRIKFQCHLFIYSHSSGV